jgi:hypothetical protein
MVLAPLPSRWRALRLVSCLCLSLVAFAACGQEAPPPPARPTTLGIYPHAMDRLARLERAQYSDKQPKRVLQAIMCERVRVRSVLGSDFPVRVQLLSDSVSSEFTAEQKNRLENQLGGGTIELGSNPVCDSLNIEAERELPLSTTPRRDPSALSSGTSGDSTRR